jgi:hypothetical protein
MACCAFMTFTVIPAGGRLLVDVEVPAASATLDGLAGIAELIVLSEHRRGTGELQRRARRKVAEVDARIGQLQQVREALLAVAAADCESLTDCSCGLGGPLPALEPAGPDRDQR